MLRRRDDPFLGRHPGCAQVIRQRLLHLCHLAARNMARQNAEYRPDSLSWINGPCPGQSLRDLFRKAVQVPVARLLRRLELVVYTPRTRSGSSAPKCAESSTGMRSRSLCSTTESTFQASSCRGRVPRKSRPASYWSSEASCRKRPNPSHSWCLHIFQLTSPPYVASRGPLSIAPPPSHGHAIAFGFSFSFGFALVEPLSFRAGRHQRFRSC